jgi:hypothetical protein
MCNKLFSVVRGRVRLLGVTGSGSEGSQGQALRGHRFRLLGVSGSGGGMGLMGFDCMSQCDKKASLSTDH